MPTVSYAASRVVRRDLARFEATCSGEPTASLLRGLHNQYRTLDRVLVVDALSNTRGVNGVGNLFGDYVLWFITAIATKRALFIHWSDGHHAADPRRRRDPRHNRFDLSLWYTGEHEAMDWAWSPENSARVQHRWGPSPVLAVRHDARAPCASLWRTLVSDVPVIRLTLPPGSATALVPMCTRNGSAPRVRLELDRLDAAGERGQRLNRRALESAAEQLGNQAGGMSLFDLAAAEALMRGARAAQREGAPVRPWLVELNTRLIARGLLWREPGHNTSAGRLSSCALHLMMRPRPRLQRALAPYLDAFEPADALVAVHVRSGWVDDMLSVPDELEGAARATVEERCNGGGAHAAPRISRALASVQRADGVAGAAPLTPHRAPLQAPAARDELAAMLAPSPRDGTGRSCLELPPHQCVPSKSALFAAGLRELLAPQRLRINGSEGGLAGWYGGVDPIAILHNASERWRLLNSLDEADPPAQPHVRRYDRHVGQVSTRDLRRWMQAQRCGGDAAPRVRALDALPPPRTKFAHAVECAVRLAASLAAHRAHDGAHDGAHRANDGARGRWRLHVASDAPGLTAMLQRLPGLRRAVVGCLSPHCVQHASAGAQHSQRAGALSNDSLQVAIDLWVHGVADRVLAVTQTSFTSFATRSWGAGGSPQLVEWPVAGVKFLPLCDSMPPPLPSGQDRMARAGCLALRWAVLSSVAARAVLAPDAPEAAEMSALSDALRNSPLAAAAQPGQLVAPGCSRLEGDWLTRSYEDYPAGYAGCALTSSCGAAGRGARAAGQEARRPRCPDLYNLTKAGARGRRSTRPPT